MCFPAAVTGQIIMQDHYVYRSFNQIGYTDVLVPETLMHTLATNYYFKLTFCTVVDLFLIGVEDFNTPVPSSPDYIHNNMQTKKKSENMHNYNNTVPQPSPNMHTHKLLYPCSQSRLPPFFFAH